MLKRKSFDELAVGMKEYLVKAMTDEVVRGFSEISEDCNPLHLDDDYAEKTIFGRRIAHGMICGGLISAVLGTKLPGLGSIYLSQELKFKAPVFIDDTVTAYVEIIELEREKKRIKLATWCENQEGKKVVEGVAKILLDQ
ncbi:MAG TPA: MaoC family dehydratase [Chroococcales cyanobacterium]|jgi:3-hydroxybutyryl-CoA dehydratase